ncbi:MAG TPA: hypothetical protein VIY48_00845 [Candidatus Paceibacterota bacterium]
MAPQAAGNMRKILNREHQGQDGQRDQHADNQLWQILAVVRIQRLDAIHGRGRQLPALLPSGIRRAKHKHMGEKPVPQRLLDTDSDLTRSDLLQSQEDSAHRDDAQEQAQPGPDIGQLQVAKEHSVDCHAEKVRLRRGAQPAEKAAHDGEDQRQPAGDSQAN